MRKNPEYRHTVAQTRLADAFRYFVGQSAFARNGKLTNDLFTAEFCDKTDELGQVLFFGGASADKDIQPAEAFLYKRIVG